MSIVHVSGGGGSSIASDRTSFCGARIPGEILQMSKHLKNMSKASFRKLLQIIVADCQGNLEDTVDFSNLACDVLNEEEVAIVFSGLHKLLKLALRIPQASLKQETFKEDLLDIRIPEEFATDISSVVFGARRVSLDENVCDQNLSLPKIESFRWRVDVGISTGVLNRVLEPSVLLHMRLSNGKMEQFEVSISRFHKLRHSVASVLKEMKDLEKRSILKIQD